jgi:alcohol dehydrogenase
MSPLTGLVRHACHLVRPSAVPAMRVALERDARVRGRRLVTAARDAVREFRRPTRPRMRALVVTAPGQLRWRSVPAPARPGPHEAVVHPIAIATCDMDRSLALGATPFPVPLRFGHECVARVLAVGGEVRDVAPGDVVVVPFQISCGDCGPCRYGRTANCASVPPISMYGFGLAGGHWGGAIADELTVPFADGMLVPLPDGIDPAAAASVADNVSDAYRHIGPHLGAILAEGRPAEVLIMGSPSQRTLFTASVPLYTGLIAHALGAQHVTLVDARPEVRAQADALGIDAVTPGELRGSYTAPLVVDLSTRRAGLRRAVAHTAPDGVCSSSGSLDRTARLPFSAMFGRNVTVHVGRASARCAIPGVLELMTTGRLAPERVTTQLAPIDDAVAALGRHIRGSSTKTILFAE